MHLSGNDVGLRRNCLEDGDGDGICDALDWGCIDPWAFNYNPEISVTQDSCVLNDGLMLKGLMNLPIANEFEGFPFFIHLEALQAVSDLSNYGIANRAQSGTANEQGCAVVGDPARLPEMSLNAGDDVLVFLTTPASAEWTVANVERVETYFGDYWGEWEHIVFLTAGLDFFGGPILGVG